MKTLLLSIACLAITPLCAAPDMVQFVEDYVRLKGPNIPFGCAAVTITNISDQPVTLMSFRYNPKQAEEDALEARGALELAAGESITVKFDRAQLTRGNLEYRVYAYHTQGDLVTKLPAQQVLTAELTGSGLCRTLVVDGKQPTYGALRMEYTMSALQKTGLIAAGVVAALAIAVGVGYYTGIHQYFRQAPVWNEMLNEHRRHEQGTLEEAFKRLDNNQRLRATAEKELKESGDVIGIGLGNNKYYDLSKDDFDRYLQSRNY